LIAEVYLRFSRRSRSVRRMRFFWEWMLAMEDGGGRAETGSPRRGAPYYSGLDRGPASAFTIAFQIPNLVSNLFANAALSAAFVPVFTDLLQQGKRKEAFRLASTLFWIILIVLGAFTAFFVLAAGVIMPLFTGPTFNAPLDDLTVGLSQVLFPVALLIGLIGLLVGVLQSHEHFTIPAISPAVCAPALPGRL
jgi:Na+-driven multidrug efflux pump